MVIPGEDMSLLASEYIDEVFSSLNFEVLSYFTDITTDLCNEVWEETWEQDYPNCDRDHKVHGVRDFQERESSYMPVLSIVSCQHCQDNRDYRGEPTPG
jgi:hypothetical protein